MIFLLEGPWSAANSSPLRLPHQPLPLPATPVLKLLARAGEFYEMRRYMLQTAATNSPKLFGDALIPALARMGLGPVGAFRLDMVRRRRRFICSFRARRPTRSPAWT